MKDDSPNLDRKQEQVITALLTSPTLAAAAKSCRLSATSLWRMQQEPAFAAAYADARRKAMEQALGALQKATGAATEGLVAILQDKGAPSSAKVAAARCILEFAFKGTELLETEARLTALEAAIHDSK